MRENEAATPEHSEQPGASDSTGILSDIESSVLIYAARYAHNRNTGAALQVVTQILSNWDRLSEKVREQIKREASSAVYNHDDWNRIIHR